MQDDYIQGFEDYAKNVKRVSNYKFKLNMEEIQSESLKFIPLDLMKDIPLPDWAKRIVFESHLSKRTKLLLLQYHDKKIREFRIRTSSTTGETENEKTGRTEYETFEDEESEED